MNSAILEYIKEIVPQEDILLDEPMSRHTTFRLGGEAKCLLKIKDKGQLVKLIPYLQITGQDYYILGNGSNLLVGDKGYSGFIVKLDGSMGSASISGNRGRRHSHECRCIWWGDEADCGIRGSDGLERRDSCLGQ